MIPKRWRVKDFSCKAHLSRHFNPNNVTRNTQMLKRNFPATSSLFPLSHATTNLIHNKLFYNIHRRQKNERISFVMYAYALPHELPNTEKKLLRTERLWMCHILKVLIPNNLIFASSLSVSPRSSRADNANVNERQKWKKTEENISFQSILWQMRLWCVLMELNVCIFVIYATYPRGEVGVHEGEIVWK